MPAAADEKLRDTVLAKTDDPLLAKVKFNGVRFQGSPYFYNWYRWGYDWSHQRMYRALTLEEKRMVTDYRSNPVSPCGSVEQAALFHRRDHWLKSTRARYMRSKNL